MSNIMKMVYSSSLTNLCELNSSFDMGVLRICYTGENRNGSFISKEAIQKSIKTIYNCPLVCHYDRETNSLGGHDVELVNDGDGNPRLVNMTTPVGVIPESAKVWFDNYEEEDGTVHEYLYSEVLLWKRQEAYKKIKDDGITAHSMEISVTKGKPVDGLYHIEEFEFNAFALIGVTPCYESSELAVFSQDFKRQMAKMVTDLKKTFNGEGGNKLLDEEAMFEAMSSIEDNINGNTVGFSTSESNVGTNEATVENTNDGNGNTGFALTSNMVDEIDRMLSEEKVSTDWGEYSRYIYIDCDFETGEAYCWDRNDWLLYGFHYSVDGDSVKIDFQSKKRKKFAIVDFEGGEQDSPIASAFALFEEKLKEYSGIEEKYNAAAETIANMETELNSLKQFKADVENETAKEERIAVLGKFEDLTGIDAFEELRKDCMDYDLETLEEKCFAIRGRNIPTVKFSNDEKPNEAAPKLKVVKPETSDEPYGGIFLKYHTDK